MIPRERIIRALHIEEADTVPIGEELIDGGPTLKKILGRIPVHANFDLQMRMLAAGKRDKLIEREKKDILDLIKKLKLDIYMVGCNVPKEYIKPIEIEENTWLFIDKDTNNQKIISYAPSSDMTYEVNCRINNIETLNEHIKKYEQENASDDPSTVELLEEISKSIGDKVFIISLLLDKI